MLSAASATGRTQPPLRSTINFLRENQSYPDTLAVYKKLLAVARRLDKKADVERCEKKLSG